MFKRGTTLVLVVMMILSIFLAGCNQTAVSEEKEKDEVKVVDSNKEQDKDTDLNNEETEENNVSKESEEKDNIVFVSASKLNVRSEGSTDGSKVGSAIKGAAVKILDEVTNEAGEATWYLSLIHI